MSLYVGDVGGTPILHVTRDPQTISTLQTASPISVSSFHSKADFSKVVLNEYLTYVGTVPYGGYRYTSTINLENIYLTPDLFILVLVEIAGVTYIDVPDSFRITSPNGVGANKQSHLFKNFSFYGFYTQQPTSVRIIQTTKYTLGVGTSILINANSLIVGGIDFTENVLTISDGVNSDTDTSYTTNEGNVNIFNSAGTSLNWVITGNSIGRRSSLGGINYLVSPSTSTYSKYTYIGTGGNSLAIGGVGASDKVIVTIHSYGTEGTGNGVVGDYFTSTFIIDDTTPLNSYVFANRPTITTLLSPAQAIVSTSWKYDGISINVYYAFFRFNAQITSWALDIGSPTIVAMKLL